ncbi:MAG TPA: hypothetical protein VGJ84_05585 [Polyangiaceae bacterium]
MTTFRCSRHLSRSALAAGILVTACLHPPAESASSSPVRSAAANGPSSVPTGPYVWKNVTILGGGFVTGVIFSPAEKDLVYARTDVGGAYRWSPSANQWIPITDMFGRDDNNFLGIESIAPDPVDPNKVYMAVGTYTASWAGKGALLRSNDRGNSWQRTDIPFKNGGNENGRSTGERMAVDPNLPSILFFGTRKAGLWKSVDSGVHWNSVDFPIKEEPLGVGIAFVAFNAKSGASGKATPVLYAGVAIPGAGLYRSTDAGETWKAVPGQPAGLMPSHGGFDSSGILYLSYGNLPGPSDVTNEAVWKHDPKNERCRPSSPAWERIAPAGAARSPPTPAQTGLRLPPSLLGAAAQE